MRILYIIVFLISTVDNLAQCIVPEFSIPEDACLRENIAIENDSDSGSFSYEWDFCAGDMKVAPEANTVLVNSNFLRARAIRFVQEGDNWFAFSISATGNILMRLDFGTDIESIPSFHPLGNIEESLSNSFGFDIVQSEGIWHIFVANGGNKNILRFSFNNGITSAPALTIVETQDAFISSGPNSIRIVKEGETYFAFVSMGTLASNSKIVRLNFGSSILNMNPAVSEFAVPGSNQLRGLAFAKECNNWIGFAISSNTNAMYRLDFNSGIDGAPNTSLINTGSTILNTPVNVEILKEGGAYYALVQNARVEEENAALYRISLGESLTGVVQGTEKLEMPELTGGAYALDVIEYNSSWYSFTFNLAAQSLLRMDFSVQCPASAPVSYVENPLPVMYHAPGKFYMTLEMQDEYGNTFSKLDSVVVSALTAPDIDFDSENICVNNNIIFESVNTSGDIALYDWHFGDGNTSSGSNPVHQFAYAGSFVVDLEITGTNGCHNAKSRTLTAYDPPVSDFIFPPGLLCTNNEIDFQNTTIDTYEGNLSYQWFVDETLINITRDVKFTFETTGTKTIKLITSIPGCADEIIKTTSSVQPGPVVDFSYTGACEQDVFQFQNEMVESVESYFWDFATGETSTEPNPPNIFVEFGDYSVSLTVTNTIGCENKKTKSVTVNSKPDIDFQVAGPPSACSGNPTYFLNQSLNPDGRNLTTWSWDFGDTGNTATVKDPEHIFAAADSYDVSLSATTEAGCGATVTKAITILPSPSTGFTFTPACDDKPVEFSAPQENNIDYWYWEIGTAYYTTSSLSHSFRTPGDHAVLLEVASSNGCRASVNRMIHVPEPLSPDFSFTKNCIGHQASFTDITTGTDPVVLREWQFTLSGTSSGSPAYYTFHEGGNKMVQLKVTGQSGCNYIISKQVNIAPAPVAAFNANPVTGGQPLQVSLNNTSSNATHFLWRFSDAEGSTTTEVSPVFTFYDIDQYDVELTAYSAEQCEDTFGEVISTVAPLPDVDLEMISLSKNSDGSFKLIVTIHNKGNTVLNDLPVDVNFSGLITLREIVEGPIGPASKYNLVLSPGIMNIESLRYLCVSTEVMNDLSPQGNRICEEFENALVVFPAYPNPATATLNLEWIPAGYSTARISLTDALGRTVFTDNPPVAPGLNHYTLDLSGFRNGIYYLIINDGAIKNSQRILISGKP